MIERQFTSQKLKEFQIQEFISQELSNAGHNRIEIKRTPLGEKIIVYTSKPGLVVGRKGENIQHLTEALKKKFNIENPQIEIAEVENAFLDPNFIVDRIASVLERFGSQRFKSTGYRTLQEIMDAGAIGAEIIISGTVPSTRARSWRFSAGYLKKSGDISQNLIKKTNGQAFLKQGVIGIKVSIMTPDIKLPDKVIIKPKEEKIKVEEIKPMEIKEEVEEKPKKTRKKKDADNKKE